MGAPWNNLAVVATAEHIGVREGRRIRGRYEITARDLNEGLRHELTRQQLTAEAG